MRRPFHALAYLAISFAAGCGKSGRLEVTGTVTARGKPLPRGQVVFIPDAARGGGGAGGAADVVDGRLRSLPNLGPSPGPYLARVTGYDGVAPAGPDGEMSPLGRLLFAEVNVPIEVPDNGEVEIVVPAP